MQGRKPWPLFGQPLPPSPQGELPLSLATDHCSQPLLLPRLCCGFTPKIGGSLCGFSPYIKSDPWWTGSIDRDLTAWGPADYVLTLANAAPLWTLLLNWITFAFPAKVFFPGHGCSRSSAAPLPAQARACGKTLIRDLTAALSTLQHG